MWKPPKPPKCRKCGRGDCHVVENVKGDPEQGHTWLCGSCEYLRDNADAPLGEPPTLESIQAKKLPLQKERLF